METGPRIGSYVVREVLGQGGMGTVYLAEHSVIGKKVAIKVLKRDLAGHDSLVARFINEARANAVVRHAGIVDVFDVGTLPSGVPYIVMEYLRGESLAQRLAKSGPLPVEGAATIAWETASAVGAAHAKGIIHRDLKPENLFLARDPTAPEVEKVKVLDFGIAKLHADPNQVNTQTGAVMGTPAYMSPEQCRGAKDEVDQRTDIYSLGAILYEMLVGKPPFEGEAFGDLLLRHMTEPVTPPSSRRADVPASLNATVLRALAKRREERYSSMREFQQGLSEAMGQPLDRTPAPFDLRRPGAGTLTPPISQITPPLDESLRPRRTGMIVGLTAAGILAVGGILLATSGRRTPPASVRPVAPRVEALPSRAMEPDAAIAARPAPPPPPPPDNNAASAPASAKKHVRKNRIEVKQW
jgi:serine/threonine protein kinase